MLEFPPKALASDRSVLGLQFNRDLRQIIDYLLAENRTYREILGNSRILLSDTQWRRLPYQWHFCIRLTHALPLPHTELLSG